MITTKKHEMCKTNVKTNFYYVNKYKHKYEKNTTWDYGVRSYLILVLNRLKEMRSPTFIYTLLGTYLKKASKEVFMCASSKNVSWEPS
jgi:hypothetical protein